MINTDLPKYCHKGIPPATHTTLELMLSDSIAIDTENYISAASSCA